MADTKSNQMAAIGAKQDIEIELATRPALRLWQGREKTPKRHGILGIPGFCKLIRGIEQSIRNDDPYADYYYHKIETAIEELAFDLESELKDIQSLIEENTPGAMRLPDVGSKDPVVVPIRFASRLGFQLVYQLLNVDQVVLKILLASHVGLLGTKEKFQTLARVETRFRGVLHLVFQYRHTGVTRDDIAANNQKAVKARELMGELEEGYLEGSLRSENAPALPAKRLQALGKVMEKPKQRKAKSESLDSEAQHDRAALEAELDKVLEEVESESGANNDQTNEAAANLGSRPDSQ